MSGSKFGNSLIFSSNVQQNLKMFAWQPFDNSGVVSSYLAVLDSKVLLLEGQMMSTLPC